MIWTGGPSVGDQWVKYMIGRSVGWSVGGQFGPLLPHIIILLVGWSPMERKRGLERSKKEIEKYLVGLLVGGWR